MGEYYIGQYRDHYAIFDSMDRVQTQYDTHAEAKADLDSYNKTGKPLPESAVPMNEGIFGLGKKKEIPEVTVDEIKIVSTNFRKAYDNWWFYLPLKDNMDKDMLCDISNRIRKICNSEYGFDAYPTEFMVCSPKDIVREYKVNDYFDKEYLKRKNNIVIFDYEFIGKSNIKSVASLKQRLGARYFNDVVNNAVYYQIKDDPKNKGIPIPELINDSKNYAVSYIDKDTLMAMYNYFASRTSANESVSFYEHTLNEGVFAAINIGFWGFVGLCCIISGILDKKHGKEVKANLTDAEFKAIKNDTLTVAKSLIAAQKSSPFYDNIYKYNRITQDSYKDMIDNFNKGNLYSCTVRFFDAENFENYKSYYKEYGEWGNSNSNWEKLEKSVNADMVKIIESLGFNIKTGKSSKYPNCEVRVADGEVVYVYPKAPDDILERGKKSKKKLNEDHSEISNDPEMEKLLALAGCTIEDLDTINNEEDIELDDDDPIDANTSREIDAIMDESFLGIKSKKEKNAKEVTKVEFDKLINDMVSINDAIISKLKTSKWWKIIFEPCYNNKYYKTPDIHEEAAKYKRDFSAGKCIDPAFSSKFTNINSSDPEIYVNLDDPENIDLSNLDNGYRESKKLIEEAIKKFGFSADGKSTKYPDIKVSISQGSYISFDISPIYTGCYKLKETDKKPQNESVVDDVRKDIDSYENEINITLTAARKYIKEAKTYTDKISAKRLTGSSGKIAADKANKEFNNKCDDIFSDEAAALQASYGSSLNKRSSFIRIYGYDSSKLNDQQKELYRKLDDKNNGKYFVEFKQIVNDLNKINDSLLAISAKHNNEPTYNISQVNAVIKQNNRMFNELSVFASDMDELQKLIGNSKTRMLFGKYIKDVVNESIEDLDYLMESIFMDIDH